MMRRLLHCQWAVSLPMPHRLLSLHVHVRRGSVLFAMSDPAPSPASLIDSGATAWVLVSSALVLLMTPALGLFCKYLSPPSTWPPASPQIFRTDPPAERSLCVLWCHRWRYGA